MDESYYENYGGVRDVYRGRPPPRSEDPQHRPRDRGRQERDAESREYERVRSLASPRESFSERDYSPDQRVPSPKRVTWKNPVEQQKSQNQVRAILVHGLFQR